uniref:Egg protein n=1 Tax=Schistosoma mansoni TaxID=6183 RepID=A0A5K4FBA3_SCHMA
MMWNKLIWIKMILVCAIDFQTFMYQVKSDSTTEAGTASFLIRSIIYTDINGTYYQWKSELQDVLSTDYMTLANNLCNLTIESSYLGDPIITKNAKCFNIIFLPFDITNQQLRTTSNEIDNVTITGVQGNVNIELISINASFINESILYNILVNGYNQLNKTLNIFVMNIEIYHEMCAWIVRDGRCGEHA